MDKLTRFWLDWAVQVLVAAGTIGAVFAALFGDWLRAKLVRLSLSVTDSSGVYMPFIGETRINGHVVKREPGEARYYRVRVANARPRFQAHKVDVWLLQLDQLRADGTLSDRWKGEIPLIWEHKDFIPGSRNIGKAVNADVCSVIDKRVLTLQVLIPALSLRLEYREACNLLLTLEARSDEGNSPSTRLHIWWDGLWDRDDQHMVDHLKFAIVQEDHMSTQNSTPQIPGHKRDLSKYREWLVSAEKDSQDQFDKTVLSLSGGALGISFVFLKDVIGESTVHSPTLLMVSWMAWGLSSFAVLASFYLSHLALRRAITQVDSGTIGQQRAGGWLSIATAILNATGAILFFAGVCFIVAFASANLLPRGVAQHAGPETPTSTPAPAAPGHGPNAAPGTDKEARPTQ
jgi:hypothetical protein